MDTRQNAQAQKEGYDNFTYYATEDIKDDFCEYHMSKLAPILDAHTASVRSILEIGFCSGRLMERMHERYPDASIGGTEVRPQFVEKMRAQGFDCHCVTDEIIPGSDCYDLIYGTSVLHHFSAPYDFLRHAYGRLNPGGLLVFSCEPHMYNLPCIAYSTVRRIWHLEKHLLKLTKKKVVNTAKQLTPKYRFYYDDASYFPAFPLIYRVYKALHLTGVNFLSEFHIVLEHE